MGIHQFNRTAIALAAVASLGIATAATSMADSKEAAKGGAATVAEQAQQASQEAMQAGREAAKETMEGAQKLGEKVEQGADSAARAAQRTANSMERQYESWSDRARIDAHMSEKDALEERLMTVQTRDGYRSALEAAGYQITSVNYRSEDSLEYEIVKGQDTYEVQLDFDGAGGKASSIDVTSNLWRADSTKQAMMGASPADRTTMYDKDVGPRYSDRRYVRGMTDEKSRLETMLPAGLRAEDYQRMLTEQGYQVTSINDREADYLEFEIVKAQNSYEVQIDRDPGTGLAQSVDVATNIWQSEATERALGEK